MRFKFQLEPASCVRLVEVIGAEHCLHARGRPGFLARMHPKFIVCSEVAWNSMNPCEQGAHWLGTTVERGSSGSMPIYKAWPCLLVGALGPQPRHLPVRRGREAPGAAGAAHGGGVSPGPEKFCV
jgi:hypothetical protein